MSKTAYSIYLDYQNAIKQAERLEQAAKDLKREASKLSDCRRSISTSWKGDNASTYLRKVKTVESDISKKEKNITKAAAAIRKIATETYRAEKAALELAKIRKA